MNNLQISGNERSIRPVRMLSDSRKAMVSIPPPALVMPLTLVELPSIRILLTAVRIVESAAGAADLKKHGICCGTIRIQQDSDHGRQHRSANPPQQIWVG